MSMYCLQLLIYLLKNWQPIYLLVIAKNKFSQLTDKIDRIILSILLIETVDEIGVRIMQNEKRGA